MTMETPGTTRKTLSYRRLSKVCARCKKRKTKCDFNFPSCGPCKKAGAVCQGYNSVAETEVPRSLVRSLEDQVAQLESQVEKFRQSKNNLPGMFASIIAKATLSIGLSPSRSFFHSTVSSALFLHPSCPPLPVARSQAKRFSRQARRPSSSLPCQQKHQLRQAASSTNLKTVPYAAIDHMVKNYTNIHLPQYPCILEPWLHQVLKRVLEEKSGDTDLVLSQGISVDSGLGHFDYFVVFIILAISSLTLTWRNESQAVAASDSFCASALNHLQLITEVDEIQGLQASLLLAHYAHMNPEKADNWICISNATKIVLDLGLHIKPAKMLDPEQAQLRCQLFRVTYGMERSMCGILRLPLSFPEESITVEFDMASIDGTYLNEAQRKESSANHIYLYRALETESHRVLHLEEEVQTIQGKTIPEWVQDITSRLEIWYKKAKGFSVHQMLEFRDVQYSHLRARLHRPTPRLRTRTPEDRQICLEACQMLVEDYQRQVKHRRLFYPWHGCHILFEAAVIMLDACWCSRDWEPHRQQARFILSITLPDCLTLLSKVGERWHEAALCAEHLRPVVHEVTKTFNDRITQDVDMNAEETEAATTEKLKQLLFPDGPLAWNARTDGGRDANGSVNDSGGGSQGIADVGFGSLSGLEGFQWDARWDLADILYGSLDPNIGLL